MFTEMYLSFSPVCGLYSSLHEVRLSVSPLEGSINVGELYFGKMIVSFGFLSSRILIIREQ